MAQCSAASILTSIIDTFEAPHDATRCICGVKMQKVLDASTLFWGEGVGCNDCGTTDDECTIFWHCPYEFNIDHPTDMIFAIIVFQIIQMFQKSKMTMLTFQLKRQMTIYQQ